MSRPCLLDGSACVAFCISLSPRGDLAHRCEIGHAIVAQLCQKIYKDVGRRTSVRAGAMVIAKVDLVKLGYSLQLMVGDIGQQFSREFDGAEAGIRQSLIGVYA